jgi:hypothetical protein
LQNLYLLVGGLARKLTSSDDDIRVHAFLAMNKIADVVGIKERTREPRFLSERLWKTCGEAVIKLMFSPTLIHWKKKFPSL